MRSIQVLAAEQPSLTGVMIVIAIIIMIGIEVFVQCEPRWPLCDNGT